MPFLDQDEMAALDAFILQIEPLKTYVEFYSRPAVMIHQDPRTPPVLFATVAQEFSDREGRNFPVGTPVRVTMVSRFGDIGITDVLTAVQGYTARLYPNDGSLKDWRTAP